MSILDVFRDDYIQGIEADLKALKTQKRATDEARIAAKEAVYVEASDAAILAQLHPTVRVMNRELLIKSKQAGLRIGIHMGGRAIELQNSLYRKGRKLENGIWLPIDPIHRTGIVTNAPGGLSWHNYFCATDDVMDGSPKPGYQYTWNGHIDANKDGRNDWDQFGEIAESVGLTWGGRWRPPKAPVDVPHTQYHSGIATVQEALAIYRNGGMEAVWEQIK